jgi:hypothetical protein
MVQLNRRTNNPLMANPVLIERVERLPIPS